MYRRTRLTTHILAVLLFLALTGHAADSPRLGEVAKLRVLVAYQRVLLAQSAYQQAQSSFQKAIVDYNAVREHEIEEAKLPKGVDLKPDIERQDVDVILPQPEKSSERK